MSALSAVAVRPEPDTVPHRAADAAYNPAIGYLRAFITLLVLAHHSVLAYVTFGLPVQASLDAPLRWWEASPIADSHRWAGFDFLTGFNDMFFMSLMFFLSGLFVWPSLQRKGAGHFLRDRALRLGVPFTIAAAIVAPIAYYPSYLQTGAHGIVGFWQQWRSLGNWPAGPAWFVWVLLAFDVIAALLFVMAPKWGEWIGRISAGTKNRPIGLFFAIVAISAITFIPLAVIFNPLIWSAWGPFAFQTSRILHYLAYFLIGGGVGAYGVSRGLLAQDGKLARRWWSWAFATPICFLVAGGTGVAAMTQHSGSRGWEIASEALWVLSCATSSFAFLAIFTRFARCRGRIWDSLSVNAYGMYLIHYAFVGWLQYVLLPTQLPAIARGTLVFGSTVLLSWGTTAALRRVPVIARII